MEYYKKKYSSKTKVQLQRTAKRFNIATSAKIMTLKKDELVRMLVRYEKWVNSI